MELNRELRPPNFSHIPLSFYFTLLLYFEEYLSQYSPKTNKNESYDLLIIEFPTLSSLTTHFDLKFRIKKKTFYRNSVLNISKKYNVSGFFLFINKHLYFT